MQLDALCHALRVVLSTRSEIGADTRTFIKTVRDRFVTMAAQGITIEHLPPIGESTPTADVYVAAELLRSTVFAFLTPEEIDSRSRFGFTPD